ncbi:hypothetical protein HHK36_006925 [Tetracentron sinense]|uniref:Cytochrome P450 n=1 Tax=Tetracentron sinense TaxID=13715 RepID=A0A834ZI20_TETSI|nr:hypothetical protein HHK36_006925 [Tetracentron sinense]
MFYSYFLLLLALYILTKHFLTRNRNRNKNLPPSPLSLPIIGHLYLLKNPLHRTLATTSDRHGPTLFLRFGSRPVLLVSSPAAAEECFTKNDIIFANRPRFLVGKLLGYNYSNLVWASYGDHWRNLRRITSLEILSSTRLQTFSGIRADEVRSLIRRLVRGRGSGSSADDAAGGFMKTVDMKLAFFGMALNVMMRMIAGKRYYGEKVSDMEEAKRFREIVEETFLISGVTNLGDFLPVMKWVGFINGLEKRFVRLQAKRDGLMQELIDQHRRILGITKSSSGERKKTIIEVLLSLQETEPEIYTDQIIRGLLLDMFAGGTDTSSGTLEWALSLLLNNPEVLKKAQVEIDVQVGHDRLLEESDLSKLPYLHGIINETLRMYPPGPLLPHESSEACIIEGFSIPRGTMLLVNLWAIQNDPKVWVEPTKFKPERFEGLEGTRDGFKLMPFGSGRRGCPGEGLGMRVVGLALGSLIQCLEWERIGEEMVDMTEGTGLSLPKAQALEAKCRPRPNMVNLTSQL